MKVAAVKLKMFEEVDAAALEAAYDTWRKAAAEAQVVEIRLTHDGTNLVLAVFHTAG
jgi:hypothetical protein